MYHSKSLFSVTSQLTEDYHPMGLRTIGTAIFSVLEAKGLVTQGENEAFILFFMNEGCSKYIFSSNGTLLRNGWFQKGVGICCQASQRASNMTLLRETNHNLHKVPGFQRPNPTPDQQRQFLAARRLLEIGGGMAVSESEEVSAVM